MHTDLVTLVSGDGTKVVTVVRSKVSAVRPMQCRDVEIVVDGVPFTLKDAGYLETCERIWPGAATGKPR